MTPRAVECSPRLGRVYRAHEPPTRAQKHENVAARPQAQTLRPSQPHAKPMPRADATGFLVGQWQQTWLQQLCCGSSHLANDAAPRRAKARRANRDNTPDEMVAGTGAEPEPCSDARLATQRRAGPGCKTIAPALQIHASRQPLIGR